MTPRVALVANALPRLGGQGHMVTHWVDALSPEFAPTVYGAAPERRSFAAALLTSLPLLRRRRDLITWWTDRAFDRAVARAIGPVDLMIGINGHCLDTARRLGRSGGKVVVSVITEAGDRFFRAGVAACATFGAVFPVRPAHVRQMQLECQEADLVCANSRMVQRQLIDDGIPPARVMAQPPVLFATDPPRAAPPDTFRVGFVGSLEPWKGFHHLVDAFRKADIAGSELRLIGGTGSRAVAQYLAHARAADRRITQEHHDVAKEGTARVYGPLSVLVQPSLSDGWGLVVPEALSQGVPVICTTSSGAAELIEDGVNGFLVPPGDPPALAERLDHLARHREVLVAMGQRAPAAVRHLTVPAAHAAYLPRFRALLGTA